jgi:hypothetical protein
VAVKTVPVVPIARVLSADDVATEPAWTLSDLDGAPPSNVETRVRFADTGAAFVALFDSTAEPPLTLERAAGGDVFRDECVELFLSEPREPSAYTEIVVSARGAVYAARVVNPDDSRETWRVTPGEPPKGLIVEVRGAPKSGPATGWTRWSCRLTVPWSSVPGGRPPSRGEERRGNATRIARGRSTAFLALSPTLRSSPPDFHVPSRFARFVF